MPAPAPFELLPPDLSPWRAGNTGTEGVWQFDGPLPGRRVLVTALVHGNELCGAWALAGLLAAGLRPLRGRLTLAFCNLAAFDRFNPADTDASRCVDEDLNRVWQADKLADPRTGERRRALALLPFVQAADWLLDIHSMRTPSPPLQLAGVQPRHLRLAQALGAPAHVVQDAGHAEGTRLRDFGRFGLADAEAGDACALLVECGGHGELRSRAVAQDQCHRFLVAAGTLDAAEATARLPGWRLPDPGPQWALRVTEAVTARNAQFRFSRPVAPLDCIAQAGTLLADNGGEPVYTPYDHCVLVMPASGAVKPGGTAVRLAQRQPLGPPGT